MTPTSRPAVGLSVGATTLAAVTPHRTGTARPVVTRAGQPVDGFVERVGDPVGIVAADGSFHPGATLLADALRELARSVTAGGPLPDTAAIAYPGHWNPAEIEALRRAMRRLAPWSAASATLTLLPDHVAALTALRSEMPPRGVAAVCDFGGSATTVTLVDLATARPLGEPSRYADFSGEAIDRLLLTHVLAAAGVPPGNTGTSAIASLIRLRAECRAAKERLSTQTVTEVPGRPVGLPRDVRLTRPELEELIATPLAGVPATVQDLLRRNKIPAAELAAVASVGGGAAIPAVTTALSRTLRVPVVTTPQPALAAAAGAALTASSADRIPDEPATAIVSPEHRPAPAALAWSQADPPEFVPLKSERVAPRPKLDFVPEPAVGAAFVPAPAAGHRRPLVIAAAVLAVIAGAGGAAALALRDGGGVAVTPPAGVTETPAAAAPSPGDQPPRTVVAVAPPNRSVEEAPGDQAPAVAGDAPMTAEPQGPPPQTATAAPITDAATPAPEVPPAPPAPSLPPIAIPSIPPIPAIPGISVLPQLLPVPPGSG